MVGHPSESTWRLPHSVASFRKHSLQSFWGAKQPCIAWQARKSLESRYRQVDPDVGNSQGRSENMQFWKMKRQTSLNGRRVLKCYKHLAPILTLKKHLLQFPVLPRQKPSVNVPKAISEVKALASKRSALWHAGYLHAGILSPEAPWRPVKYVWDRCKQVTRVDAEPRGWISLFNLKRTYFYSWFAFIFLIQPFFFNFRVNSFSWESVLSNTIISLHRYNSGSKIWMAHN